MMKGRALKVAVAAQCRSRRTVLWATLAIPFGYSVQALSAAPKKQIQLNLASDGDLLAFKPDQLTCPTGAAVHLTFSHTGKYITQDHNWVLTVPGAAEAVAQAAMSEGEHSAWTPRGDKRVIAATPPCGKGQHVSVDFVAPATGDYPFLCTTPGHGAVMHGILHVTPN